MQRKWFKILVTFCFVVVMGSMITNFTITAFANQNSQISAFVTLDGWVQRSNTWFFFRNGIRQTGWVRVPVSNGSSTLDWFYLGNDGRMRTGWARVRVSNSNSTLDWFYFGTNGRMRTGWARVRISNSDSTLDWFYFGTNGRRRTSIFVADPNSNGPNVISRSERVEIQAGIFGWWLDEDGRISPDPEIFWWFWPRGR